MRQTFRALVSQRVVPLRARSALPAACNVVTRLAMWLLYPAQFARLVGFQIELRGTAQASGGIEASYTRKLAGQAVRGSEVIPHRTFLADCGRTTRNTAEGAGQTRIISEAGTCEQIAWGAVEAGCLTLTYLAGEHELRALKTVRAGEEEACITLGACGGAAGHAVRVGSITFDALVVGGDEVVPLEANKAVASC